MSGTKMMRAIRVAQFGGPEVLKVETNVAVPTPSKTQVNSLFGNNILKILPRTFENVLYVQLYVY